MTKMTVAKLRTVARQAGIKGVSNLRKDDLEQTVMGQRDGRREAYKLQDAEWAEGIVDKVMTQGSFLLPRPVVIKEPELTPVVGKTYTSFQDFANESGVGKGSDKKVWKQNKKNEAAFHGKVRALKNIILERKLPIVWGMTDAGFTLAVRRRFTAAA